MQIRNGIQDRGLLAGVAIAEGVVVAPSADSLTSALQRLVDERKQEDFPPASVKEAVRNLLKGGGFKPSGRNKPASEYLAQSAREGRFPFINNLVDINNLVSLSSGLPISLLDANAIGETLLLRYGRDGERYVFNAAGQDIDLEGLICSCSAETDTPLGNPVKDSIAGKIKDSTTRVVGVIYAPNSMAESAKTHLEKFAELLRTEGCATAVETVIV